MTTVVKIDAHCTSDKEVRININRKLSSDGEIGLYRSVILNDGEKYQDVVYDDVEISVKEVLKQTN